MRTVPDGDSQEFSLARNEDRLLWIFGSSRSGSTWLLRMLSELDGVAAIDDPHLGHHLGVWRPIALAWAVADETPTLTTLTDLKRQNPSYFFSDRFRDAWAPALKQLITTRFDAEARERLNGARGEPVVVVKEPGSHVADLLLSLFPRSKLVFLLRDGRDVIDSWLAAYRQGSWALREGAFSVAPWGRLPLVRWQASVWLHRIETVQRAYALHDPAGRLLVRYEDLRKDPAAQLARICGRLGLETEESARRSAVEKHTFERLPDGEKGHDKAVRLARPGGWRENMSHTEQVAMHEIIGEKLAELGYPVDAASIPEPPIRLAGTG